jgi:hypothetical protein
MPSTFESTPVTDITAIGDTVIVRDMNFSGRTLSSGIILLGDDAKTAGIRPRWAQVFRVGPDQIDVAPGQWVLVEHGRWTRGSKIAIADEEITIRRVDPKDIIFVSDEEPPADDTISTAVQSQQKFRD